MISIEQAQRAIFEQITALQTEQVPVSRALNRITPENHVAPWDLPAADNSAMDGFAVRHDSLQTRFRIVGFLPAGEVIDDPVPTGCAIRIMTGAPIPPGCDTVVPIEEVEVEGEFVRLKTPTKAGSHVRRRGEDIARGDVVIPAGSVLRPQEIGMLCAMGKTTLTVYRKATVAILATGDELLEPGSPPSPGKLVNSNSYSLAAQVMDAGGDPIVLGIAADTLAATCDKIRAGLDGADMLVITGGVSVGDRDYVKAAIEQLGGEIEFWKVNMKPGKPLAFAFLDGKPIFALPGNPVAAMVSFELFVRPSMLKAMGHRRILRPVVNAHLQERAVNKGERPHLVRGIVSRHGDQYRVSTTGNQSSGRLSSLTLGNGLMRLAPESSYEAGCQVEVVLLDRWFEQGEVEQAGPSACQPEVSQ